MTPVLSAMISALALIIINKNTKLPGQTVLNDGYMMVSTNEGDTTVLINDENDTLNETISNDGNTVI